MSAPPGATPLAGTPYVLVRLLGRGSMGEVYEAVHAALGTRRAVKLLAAQHANRADLAERMRTEAQLLAHVRHPNLVEVVDLGMAQDGRIYFVMDLLEGHTLRRTIEANAPMRPALALELILPILDGLHAAHCAGIVHRDIKPENVFVCATGDVKVLDFGVAKVGLTAASMTHSTFSMGTPRYMAPEQMDGRPSDPRTDLFAVGTLLYELLTGRPPFDVEERMALAFAVLTQAPPPLAGRTPHPISPRLEAAVLRALEKKQEARFASAAEMASELRGCLAELDGPAVTEAPVEVPKKGRGVGIAIGIAAVGVVGIATAAGSVLVWRGLPRTTATAALTPTSTLTATATATLTATATATATGTGTGTGATATAVASPTASAKKHTVVPSVSVSATGEPSGVPVVKRPGSGL